jgi:hypothetical protein
VNGPDSSGKIGHGRRGVNWLKAHQLLLGLLLGVGFLVGVPSSRPGADGAEGRHVSGVMKEGRSYEGNHPH